MAAVSDSSSSSTLVTATVTAIAGDVEFAMFSVVSFDGAVLTVHTPFTLALGEEIPIRIDGIGRTTGTVTGHQKIDGRQITELTLRRS